MFRGSDLRHSSRLLRRSLASHASTYERDCSSLLPPYAALIQNLERVRKILDRPLVLAEKILYSHVINPEANLYRGGRIRGETYLQLRPQRVAMQDASAQWVPFIRLRSIMSYSRHRMALWGLSSLWRCRGVYWYPRLQFMSAGLSECAVPTSIHCDHLIQASEGASKDLEVWYFLQARIMTNKRIHRNLWWRTRKFSIFFRVLLRNMESNFGALVRVSFTKLCLKITLHPASWCELLYPLPSLALDLLSLGLEQVNKSFGRLKVLWRAPIDSHTPNAGGLGLLAIGVGGADAVDAMTGTPWELKAPQVVGKGSLVHFSWAYWGIGGTRYSFDWRTQPVGDDQRSYPAHSWEIDGSRRHWAHSRVLWARGLQPVVHWCVKKWL